MYFGNPAQSTPMKSAKHNQTLCYTKCLEIAQALKRLLQNKYFYISLAAVVGGKQLNNFSQTYLYNQVQQGKTLPGLSDLILDNLPYWDIDYIYDIFMLVASVIFIIYVVHKQHYNKIPYFLVLGGIYYLIRGIFIILTPLGNPPLFDGTSGLFNGFAKYELGVYPSGHTGIAFLYFLLAENKYYKIIFLICTFIIIGAFFFARGHYSIDILSGIIFAYAIKAFGDKHVRDYFCGKDFEQKMKKRSIRQN